MSTLETARWKNDALRIIDQRYLPEKLVYWDITTLQEVYDAIKTLAIRGAPAIGIAAAYGAYIGIRGVSDTTDKKQFLALFTERCEYLNSSRPTAVNLKWALDRIQHVLKEHSENATVAELKMTILAQAHAILNEDIAMCRAIGENGQDVLKGCNTILTHCNAGGLATSGYGTALAPVYVAKERGHKIHVYADETRPLLQGARITAFELQQTGIPVTVICDNMAAWAMKQGKIDAVIVGADRIAANGDTANKIGTYSLAIAARTHDIPFYVAAPYSTFDLSLKDGSTTPIEERDAREVTNGFGRRTVPENVAVYNPAFDVTPASLITAIITEKRIWYPPFS